MLRNDVGWTQLPQCQKSLEMPQGTPLIDPSVRDSLDDTVYKGGPLTHFEALLLSWELRQPYVISEHSFTK